MIGGGTSLGAITNGEATSIEMTEDPDHEGIYLTKGCGFFPYGIVDQHFSQRSRLGRLTLAAWLNRDKWSQAIGIDEDTALEVDLKNGTGTVWGRNHILVIDLKQSQGIKNDLGYSFKNVTLSILQQGDEIDLIHSQITIAKDKTLIKKETKNKKPGFIQTGAFGGNGYSLLDMVEELISHSEEEETLNNLTLINQDTAIQFSLKNTKETLLYRSSKQKNRFSVTHLSFDITPLKIKVLK